MRKYSKRVQAEHRRALNLDGVTALYIRVSTEKQAAEGNSLEAQQRQLTAYCNMNEWPVLTEHIYIDAGVSGKSTDRAAFQAMLQAAHEGKIARIVALKIDRIARNLMDLLSLIDTLTKLNVSLVCLKETFDTGSANGRFMLQVLGAVAELERNMIHERVDSGRRENAQNGGYNGSAARLGYNYENGVFAPNAQAPTVEQIFVDFVGGKGMAEIARELNAAGITTVNGGKWHTSTVRYVLQNGFYAGLAQWDGVEVEGTHPAIISRAVYEAAHSRLQSIKPGPRIGQ